MQEKKHAPIWTIYRTWLGLESREDTRRFYEQTMRSNLTIGQRLFPVVIVLVGMLVLYSLIIEPEMYGEYQKDYVTLYVILMAFLSICFVYAKLAVTFSLRYLFFTEVMQVLCTIGGLWWSIQIMRLDYLQTSLFNGLPFFMVLMVLAALLYYRVGMMLTSLIVSMWICHTTLFSIMEDSVMIDTMIGNFYVFCVLAFVISVSKVYFMSRIYHQNELLLKKQAELTIAYEDIVQVKEQAELANTAKTNFLANMSHEIRTPINTILGMDEMILRECEDPTILSYAMHIQNVGKSLVSIINDILDFSKIESNKMELVEEPYELRKILFDTVNMIRVRVNEKGLELHLDISEHTPNMLMGDEVRIRQILSNLLTNAVKYTSQGSVTLHVDTIPGKEENRIDLIVDVEDTGVGIREEDQKHLFESFYRIDMKAHRNIEGTGLGLSITKNLVQRMGGRLKVNSRYGEGSVFTAVIPQVICAPEPIGDFGEYYRQASIARTAYKESFMAPNAHILVVDDNELNLAVVKNLLKQTKIQVDTVLSGRECLEKIQENHYDIICLDHMMPHMDGIETLQRMQRMESSQCKDSVVIALTANAVNGASEMYLAKGFDDYMSKPILGDELEAMILKYLPAQKVITTEKLLENVDEKSDGEDVKTALMTEQGDTTKEVSGMRSKERFCDILAVFGIKLEEGLKYTGGQESDYYDVVKIFYESASQSREQLQQYFQQEDAENYRILVHALKSNAKSIGAEQLYDLAYEHEQQSKAGNWLYIRGKWESLMTEWDRVLNGIRTYMTLMQ